jgi:branched-chain amino acid transport system substrate-binding protein
VKQSKWKKYVAIGMVPIFVLAACGGSDDDADTTTPPVDVTEGASVTEPAADVTTPVADTEPAADVTTPAESDTTLAAEEGGEFGLIDDVYQGAAGFSVDPADCPEDWDPAQGITDEEVKLFISLPKAGPLAGFGLIADGMNSYFQYVNDQGGIEGRNIVMDVKDDGYAPDKTKTNVDEALGSGDYAALSAVLGTPNNLAVWDTTNDECMPQLLNATGAAQWGDVENHPWTTGMQIDYFTEAALWADWLKTEEPEAKTVAMLTFNSDFGLSYSKGFRFAADGTDLDVVAEELHEPTAPNLSNQFTTLAATDADVLLIQTSGAFCTQAMAEVEKGDWHPIVIMSATCGSLTQFFKPLIDQGLTGADTHIIQTFKDVNDPAFAEDEFVKLFKDTLTAQGLDPTQSTYATGWIFAWFMTEILQEAATYEGGLDRGNIMLAARNIKEPMPLLLDGLTSQMNGMEDAYLVEGGQMAIYTVTDPAALGSFVKVGDLLNREGELGTYATVSAAG